MLQLHLYAWWYTKICLCGIQTNDRPIVTCKDQRTDSHVDYSTCHLTESSKLSQVIKLTCSDKQGYDFFISISFVLWCISMVTRWALGSSSSTCTVHHIHKNYCSRWEREREEVRREGISLLRVAHAMPPFTQSPLSIIGMWLNRILILNDATHWNETPCLFTLRFLLLESDTYSWSGDTS